MATRVVHCKREAYDYYIGRPSIYGNPFPVTIGRARCLRMFRAYFYARIDMDPVFRREVEKLRGKKIGCWCVPFYPDCHGLIMAEWLDAVIDMSADQTLQVTMTFGEASPGNEIKS